MTMRFAILGLSAALASTAAAQTVENQIRREVTRYVAAVNGGDARVVAALYLNDPRTSSVGDGRVYRGWQRVAEVVREAKIPSGSDSSGTTRRTFARRPLNKR